MKKWIVLFLLFSSVSICKADRLGQLESENAALKSRLERIERKLGQMDVGQSAAAPKLQQSDYDKILAMIQQDAVKKKPVWSNLDIQVYGYLKLDASYDSERSSTGNYMKWVENNSSRKHDNTFNMTVKQTRLGLNFKGPETADMKTSGKVEVDFYGTRAENKATAYMRHGYLKLDWPEERFSILVGQTWDLISPLNPSTLNYSVMWWAGNVGYRRPQIRLSKSFALNDDVDVKVDGALARTIGGGASSFDPGDEGEDMGFPGVQGRVGFAMPSLTGYKKTRFGVSGHWAKEEYDTDAADHHDHYNSWSVNFDLTQPVNDKLTIKGEFYTGQNMSAYVGGIGQGVNTTLKREIAAKGGWVAASMGPWDKWKFNVGAGVDCVESDDVAVSTGRTKNSNIFGNAIYAINKNTSVGFELSQWHTEYKEAGNSDDLRAQMSFIYKF